MKGTVAATLGANSGGVSDTLVAVQFSITQLENGIT